MSCGEVCKRHLVGTADLCVHMVHFSGKAVRREPLGHGIRVEECAIDLFGGGSEHAVEPDGIGRHGAVPF